MNILITGAGGFLGRNLSASLVSKGYKVWAFINQILSRYNLPPTTKKVPERVAFNIGLFLESWYKLFHIKGKPPMTRFVALQFSRSHYFSHQKAKNDFGYEPKISIEQALDLTVRE